jgi:nitrogen fixation protein NifU and related proteins
MSDDLTDLYQQVILDHCRHPRNFHELAQATCSAHGHNPLCGDQLKLSLRLEGDAVQDIGFIGSGCCISKASASILTTEVKGRSKAEIKALFQRVHELITTGQCSQEAGKLAVFAGVHKFPARVKCAILPWHALLAAIEGKGDTVSTEKEDS